MAKGKKVVKKKLKLKKVRPPKPVVLKIKKKLTKKLQKMLATSTFRQAALMVGAKLEGGCWPGGRFFFLLSKVTIKKKGDDYFPGSHPEFIGIGEMPNDALGDLCRRIQGKVVRPDEGFCVGGKREMRLPRKLLVG